ncbi:OmpA family protein [Candidatus Methylobacter oryzae]|uniref:OmpA family protein n=1 Tax=Candidatus Methylobacter oryzae TaxID=2497749 RepID=A0ABY3CHK0_9GAMM|nr:OmpA family protein [Candidatus Methylobacter oryzae]TRX03310.1 OmpA family protein [Candidatus Methylobacter oryzae]
MRPQILSLKGSSVVLLSGLVMACTPAANMSLERARNDYQQAASDPAVKNNAYADLSAAEKLLQRAETSWNEDEDSEETDHLAYLASRKVDLARATASRVEAKKTFDELSSQKDQVRLQAREAEIRKLKAKKVPQGILVTLGDVLFDTGRANLKAGNLQNMYPLVEYLRNHPDTRVKIEGHTDDRGSADYNANLSQMRAEAVMNLLIANGIAPERITAQGMGEDYPVATNATASGRQQNRRVEVTITDMPGTQPPAASGSGM